MLRLLRVLLPVVVLVALLPGSPAGAVPAHKLRCFGYEATHVGTSGDDVFQMREYQGPLPLVVVGVGGNDELIAPDPDYKLDVYYCGGSGKDGARGNLTAFNGGAGKDWLDGNCVPRIRKSVERAWYEDC